MIFDSDDFGYSIELSDQCQSRDCRDVLWALRQANPKFKATLFTIPHSMTPELANWCKDNKQWIEIAVHGFHHVSNYECAEMTYEEFDQAMKNIPFSNVYVKGFKAPGWQISDDCYRWLLDNKYWVADQGYNDERRPKGLQVYKLQEGSVHTHTWNCVGNGVYELFDKLVGQVRTADEFRFVSEVVL